MNLLCHICDPSGRIEIILKFHQSWLIVLGTPSKVGDTWDRFPEQSGSLIAKVGMCLNFPPFWALFCTFLPRSPPTLKSGSLFPTVC